MLGSVIAQFVQHLEARHVRQAQVQHDAVGGLLAHDVERLFARAGGDDFDIVITQKLGDAHLLGRIVFHHQQPAAPRLGILLDASERVLHTPCRGRLGDKGKSAAGQAMLAVFVQGHDLDGDVPGQRILLELAQHRPAQHVGQENIQRHR